MKIGFTGTQRGMTDKQKVALRGLLNQASGSEFHHGDCVGSDAEAHHIANGMGLEPVIHPPDDPIKRAFCKANRVRQTEPYLVRNRNIVDSAELLIATPELEVETMGSGTWATVRYAVKQKKPVTVIWPDGTIKENYAS